MTHKLAQKTTWVGNNRQFFVGSQSSPKNSQGCFSFSCTKTICPMEKNSTILCCTDHIQHNLHKMKLFQAKKEWMKEAISSVYCQAPIVKCQHLLFCWPMLKLHGGILWDPCFYTNGIHNDLWATNVQHDTANVTVNDSYPFLKLVFWHLGFFFGIHLVFSHN